MINLFSDMKMPEYSYEVNEESKKQSSKPYDYNQVKYFSNSIEY